MGRLNASTVYDGDRLPLLYKLADEVTGHTIAYVMPGPNSKPSEALGLLVGIKGVRRYDETLRVNVIIPDSIDVLERTISASTSTAAPAAPAAPATPE
jgi:serine protease inhibitor ecotin